MMVSLMQPPPKPQREVTFLAAFLSEVKRYKARGLALELTVCMASSKELQVRMGRTGPKISSCIQASSQVILFKMVGSIRF